MVNNLKHRVNNPEGIPAIWHISFWALFIIYELSIMVIVSSGSIRVIDQLIHYPLNIALFYGNALIVLKNYSNRKYNWFISFLVFIPIEIILYMGVNYGLNYLLENTLHITVLRPTTSLTTFLAASVWRCLYFIGMSTCYWFVLVMLYNKRKILLLENEQVRSESKKILLEKDLLVTQNNLLRAQINPHLLFNTLNYVYTTVYKTSEQAGDVIMLLSEITHYSFRSTGSNDTVNLRDEVTAIENLIKLNQIRFNNKLCIELIVRGELDGVKIIPMLLLTFVENIFKYANLTDHDFPAQIFVNMDNGNLNFYSVNKIGKTSTLQSSNKVGLVNVKTRLANQYPDKYQLSISNKDDIFSIDLNINLHEYNKVLYN